MKSDFEKLEDDKKEIDNKMKKIKKIHDDKTILSYYYLVEKFEASSAIFFVNSVQFMGWELVELPKEIFDEFLLQSWRFPR